MSRSMIPALSLARRALACLVAVLTPVTMTLSALGRTRWTSPCLPLSLPVITTTVSPFLSFISEHLRGERDDSHESAVAQLAADWAEDARAAGGQVVLDEDGRVLVEADVAAVRTALLLLRANDDALDDVALLDAGAGDGVLDGRHEDVADGGVAAAGATEHLDHEDLLGAAVVGDAEAGFLLDHWAGLTVLDRSLMLRSLRPLEHVGDAPVLELRQRAGLHHADAVADVHVVGLVVGVQLLRLEDELVVLRVADALDDGDDSGLVHAARHDDALANLSGGSGTRSGLLAGARDARLTLRARCGGGRSAHFLALIGDLAGDVGGLFVAHLEASSISRWRMNVLMRAIWRRTFRISAVLSSWPVALRKRRFSASCFVSRSSSMSSPRFMSARSDVFLAIRTSPRA